MMPLFPATKKTERKPGRPPGRERPDERAKRLRCLFRRTALGMRTDTIATDMKVSTATVKRWLREARGYAEAASPESLREAIAG